MCLAPACGLHTFMRPVVVIRSPTGKGTGSIRVDNVTLEPSFNPCDDFAGVGRSSGCW